uniref:Uncharacterized protein n=1 Tax=viral metagenome TaxID=1070528 RepID=A0A6C0J6J9_9ZZZZ
MNAQETHDIYKLAKFIYSSKLNNKYIQPSLKLAENIIDNSIDSDIWLSFYKHYFSKTKKHQPIILTKYYEKEQVYTITSGKHNKTKVLEIAFRNNYQLYVPLNEQNDMLPDPSQNSSIEYIGENLYPLSVSQFPIKYEYNHTRQSLVWSKSFKGYKIELEALITGLSSYDDINKKLLKLSIEDLIKHEMVFSYSFRIYFNKMAIRDDIHEQIEVCLTLLKT